MVAALVLGTRVADAGRKRIVVLDFEGDRAEKFHSDVVKLLKKSHTVISVNKWNNAAADLGATKINDKNVKKVAKKLKVDGVLTAYVEKRREQYILRFKLHAGTTGKLVGDTINIQADGPKLDSSAAKDLKDELYDFIDDLASNRGGGGDDEEEEDEPKKGKKDLEEEEEEDRPRKGFGKKADVDDDEEEDRPKKNGKKDLEDEDEDRPKKSGFSRKADVDEAEDRPKKTGKKVAEEEDEEEKPKKGKKDDRKKTAEIEMEDDDLPRKSDDDEDDDDDDERRVAARDGDDDEEDDEIEASTDVGVMESALALSAGERAVDGAVGLSFNARRLSFSYDPAQIAKPPGYKGLPVAGVLLDANIYPLAFGHKRKDILKNVGLAVMYDKVLLVKSKSLMGADLASAQARYAFGLAFRYPLKKGNAMSPVVGGTLRYGRQSFQIQQAPLGDTGLPNVNYTIIEPLAFFKYPATPKITLNLSAGFMIVTNAGQIENMDQYGPASTNGFEFEGGGDYLLTKNIFARAAFKFETIGYAFEGMAKPGVAGARDSYIGGAVTAGYLF